MSEKIGAMVVVALFVVSCGSGSTPTTPSATPTPTPTPTPTASYNGNWSGTTSQGRPVSFTVSGSAMSNMAYSIQASAFGCTMTATRTSDSTLITATTFSSTVQDTGTGGATQRTIFAGNYTSTTAVSGTLTYTVMSGTCNGLSESVTWSASKN